MKVPEFTNQIPIGRLVGIEREFTVHETGRTIDFSQLLPELADVLGESMREEPDGRFLTDCGDVLYADDQHAELVSPPWELDPSLPEMVATSAAASRRWLDDAVVCFNRIKGRQLRITGYSTHISVQTPEDLDLWAFTLVLITAFGPLLQVLISSAHSKGIGVRPRAGRVEVIGEFVGETDRLRAAVTVVLAAATVSADLLAGCTDFRALSITSRSLRETLDRPGMRLPLVGWGNVFSRNGRRTVLDLQVGGERDCQSVIGGIWRGARSRLRGIVGLNELDLASSFVAGDRAAGLDRPSCMGFWGTRIYDRYG